MKQKNSLSENATKKDMKVLEGSLRKDMKVIESSLRKDMKVIETSLRAEIKFNTEEILVKVDENARNYRDEILTKLDGVMGELETIREDNLIGTHQISSLREQAEDHEKRIADLEKVQTSP